MEGGRQQIALRRVLASEPVLRYREKFGDQCRDGFGCDGLELAAKARNLPVNPLQLGTEVFDRKLVERHNRLIAYSPHSETKLATDFSRGFADAEKNRPTTVTSSLGC